MNLNRTQSSTRWNIKTFSSETQRRENSTRPSSAQSQIYVRLNPPPIKSEWRNPNLKWRKWGEGSWTSRPSQLPHSLLLAANWSNWDADETVIKRNLRTSITLNESSTSKYRTAKCFVVPHSEHYVSVCAHCKYGCAWYLLWFLGLFLRQLF